jgi:hypothetical protein
VNLKRLGRAAVVIIILFFLIGCGTSGQVTDMGIRPFEISDADQNTYSLIVGRFPQMDFPGSIAGWTIRKNGRDIVNRLLYKGQYGFNKNFIYSSNSWSDEAFYTFLIPEEQYKFEYNFPTGTGYAQEQKVVYTREISVKPGKVIYLGTHKPLIFQERSTSYNKTVTTSQYLGMEIEDNFEEDLKSLRKKYPDIFSGNKFKVTNLSK